LSHDLATSRLVYESTTTHRQAKNIYGQAHT
jgi:hypothetical protein